MSKDKTLETVQNVAVQLAPVLWGPFSDALADASMQLSGINHRKHPVLRPLVARARLSDLLESSGKLPHGWQIGGVAQRMEQLLLYTDEVQVRFLKENALVFPNGVPAAGKNMARRAFWQPSLFQGEEEKKEALPLLNLLLLWDYCVPGSAEEGFVPGSAEEGFTLRLVHTIAAGAVGRSTKIDASIPLFAEVQEIKKLGFEEVSQEENFFAEIDVEANEDSDTAS